MCPVSYLKVPNIARKFTTTVAGLMEVLDMDYEGPFPEDEYGNTYVLAIIDTFSRAGNRRLRILVMGKNIAEGLESLRLEVRQGGLPH